MTVDRMTKDLAEDWLARNVCCSILNGTKELRDHEGEIIAIGQPCAGAWLVKVNWSDRHIWRNGVPDYTDVDPVGGMGTFFHPVAYSCQWDGCDERNIAFQWRELFTEESDGAWAFRRGMAYLPNTGHEYVSRAFAWQPAYEQLEPDIACPNLDLNGIVESHSVMAQARRVAIRRECDFWTALVWRTLADPRDLHGEEIRIAEESVVTAAQAYLQAVDLYMYERYAARNGAYKLRYDMGAQFVEVCQRSDGWFTVKTDRSYRSEGRDFPPDQYEQAVVSWLGLLETVTRSGM